MSDLLIPELDTQFVFHDQPTPIPPDLRPGWRIGVILLLLRHCCRANRSSFGRLQVLNWAMLSKKNCDALIEATDGSINPDTVLVRIDPSLNRALELAGGDDVVRLVKGNRVELTENGIQFVQMIDANKELLIVEKGFVTSLGLKVSEDFVKGIFARRPGD